jgi:hypothetical protein
MEIKHSCYVRYGSIPALVKIQAQQNAVNSAVMFAMAAHLLW